MKFNINTYQHFFLEHIWEGEYLKFFYIYESAITFAQGCTGWALGEH